MRFREGATCYYFLRVAHDVVEPNVCFHCVALMVARLAENKLTAVDYLRCVGVLSVTKNDFFFIYSCSLMHIDSR